MKKNKLNLNELKINSFITEFKIIDVNTIKGGGTHYEHCSFDPCNSLPLKPNDK